MDVLFVPFGQHPCSCIPCPLGHLHVARHEGAFGFLQHRAGAPPSESVSRWHEIAVEAWDMAEEHSTSSDERWIFASLEEAISRTSSEGVDDGQTPLQELPPAVPMQMPVTARVSDASLPARFERCGT